MKQKNRKGDVIVHQGGQDKVLRALYATAAGRMVLKVLVSPVISRCAGAFLSCGLSHALIAPFIRKNNIDMSQFADETYKNYNEFFSRRIREGARVMDQEKTHLMAPCDSKLTVLPIKEGSQFILKDTPYTVSSMLKNEQLAKAFDGGYAMIFRLTVDDYHRYCYIDDGEKEENVFIPGVLHTVNPIANDVYPIYKENSREYTVLHSENFGDLVIMEVGALLVGKIVNHHGAKKVSRGEEKGYFQFGGSTVVVLMGKDRARIDEDILLNSREGFETVVRMGEKIGESV